MAQYFRFSRLVSIDCKWNIIVWNNIKNTCIPVIANAVDHKIMNYKDEIQKLLRKIVYSHHEKH